MKSQTVEKEQFVTDASGRRVGIILDLSKYERLREAAEDNADLMAYRAVKTQVAGEIARVEYATLEEYPARRSRKAK